MNEPVVFDPLVLAGFVVTGVVALLAPVVASVLLWKRAGTRWKAYGWGALTFFVSQVVLRLPWQIPVNRALAPKLTDPVWLYGWLAVSALTAALFEELGRWVALRYGWKDRSVPNAVMFGLGHGGIESQLLVGLSVVGSAVAYVLLTRGTLPLPPEQLAVVRAQFAAVTPTLALLGGLERLFALVVHVGCTTLVLRAFTPGGIKWLGAALGYHFVVDFSSVLAAKTLGPMYAEVVVGLVALPALWWTVRFWREAVHSSPA